jgi:hypothetical protein
VKRASIGGHLHLAVHCREYPKRSSSLPHVDSVRTGAGSAEALEGKSLASRQKGWWGLCGDRHSPDPEDQRVVRESDRSQKQSFRNQNRFSERAHAAQRDFHKSFILWWAIRGALCQGVVVGSEGRCHQGIGRAVNISPTRCPSPQVTHRGELHFRAALLPLSHVYSHCAKSAHATALQTIASGDQDHKTQAHFSSLEKSFGGGSSQHAPNLHRACICMIREWAKNRRR